jgi:hypothetical protein
MIVTLLDVLFVVLVIETLHIGVESSGNESVIYVLVFLVLFVLMVVD